MTRAVAQAWRPVARSASRRRVLLIAALAAVGVVASGIVITGLLAGPSQRGSASEHAARAAAHAFLTRYVAPDGRVVRWDQGGDTVSEGQSYALLLSQVAEEPETFARVWSWTDRHLLRADGLLAYLAAGDKVRDPAPASDGDLVTAWALARADGPGASGYHAAARRLAEAMLRLETTSRGGRAILAAGPWATGDPASVNPSYWALPAFTAIARLGDRSRWETLRRSSLSLTRDLATGGKTLPPDWARIDGTRATPTPAPDGHVPYVRYGPDAQRLVVWLAASCDSGARQLAASWWAPLSDPSRAAALGLDPSGAVRESTTASLSLVAAAAAAGSAGQPAQRDRLLDRASSVDAAHPTYYGAAWVALGRALLTTDTLGTCPPGGSGR